MANRDTEIPIVDYDTLMLDVTTLPIPDLTLDSKVAAEISAIHPSRIKDFTNATTFAEVDPSFRPRPKDIQRARRQLEKRLNPSQTKKQEKQALRKERAEKRAHAPMVENEEGRG